MNQPSSGRPLVTVIIPSFNHENYVEEAIRSVLGQTYPNVELIVVDDSSTDATAEIVQNLADQYGFAFVRNAKNLGINRTLDVALELSRGDYLSVLASDDMILRAKITEQVEILGQGEFDAVYGTGYSLLEDGSRILIDLAALEPLILDGSIMEHFYTDSSYAPLLQSALIRRECFLSLNDERKSFKSDDWVMLIRIAEKYRMKFVNQPWFLYRQHPSNTYRDYWKTLPNRVEVLAMVTPERLRAQGLANMFRDQAQYLYMDRKRGMAMKFLIASIALRPSPRWWGKLVLDLSKRVARQAWRRLSNSGKSKAGMGG